MTINEEEETFRILAERAYDKFITEHGEHFDYGTLASNLGPRRECWTNAWTRCKKNRKLRYAEGYIMPEPDRILRHAFCVGQDGKVIEVTSGYENVRVYAGVILDLDTVTKIREEILAGEQWHSSVLQVVLPFAHEQRGRDIIERLVIR